MSIHPFILLPQTRYRHLQACETWAEDLVSRVGAIIPSLEIRMMREKEQVLKMGKVTEIKAVYNRL